MIYNKCPHQGSSLHNRFRAYYDEIVCPYHGFRFKDGQLLDLGKPTNSVVIKDICVPSLPVHNDGEMIYTIPMIDIHGTSFDQLSKYLVDLPYYPPEEYDKQFTKITGQIRLPKNSNIVIENVLDMLHISYVHSFGNRDLPFPTDIHFEKLTEFSGRTTFVYPSGENSISKKIANVHDIHVENEFHLPSTTITRVRAGNYVKTVMTRSLSVNENETILFWVLYRNFWNKTNVVKTISDMYLRSLMHQTLEEDRRILHKVYDQHYDRYKTKYDITILQYRKCKKIFFSNE